MTSAEKSAGNRRNARASTGPKTAAGKARASLNATKHGLSVSAAPISDPETEVLARTIAGEASDPELLVQARRIAMAQTLVRRTQCVRDSLSSVFLEAVARGDNAAAADVLAQLARIERYELSALARRRFAIRDFADVCLPVCRPQSTEATAIFAKRSQRAEQNQFGSPVPRSTPAAWVPWR
jgi:hypothetical protein